MKLKRFLFNFKEKLKLIEFFYLFLFFLFLFSFFFLPFLTYLIDFTRFFSYISSYFSLFFNLFFFSISPSSLVLISKLILHLVSLVNFLSFLSIYLQMKGFLYDEGIIPLKNSIRILKNNLEYYQKTKKNKKKRIIFYLIKK